MDILKLLPVFVLILSSFGIPMPMANAEDVTETFEGGMDLQITYPESVMIGRTFSVSIHLENNGWENKQDILFTITNPDSAFISLGTEVHRYVSIGTIVGIPAGTIFSLLLRRAVEKRKKKKKA